jgi:hypothetical protein
MKRCSDCESFSRFDGIDHCNVREVVPQQWDAETCGDFDRREVVKCERCDALEATLRAIDAALENEFGGFYLSAPEGEPMFDIREMLRGER